MIWVILSRLPSATFLMPYRTKTSGFFTDLTSMKTHLTFAIKLSWVCATDKTVIEIHYKTVLKELISQGWLWVSRVFYILAALLLTQIPSGTHREAAKDGLSNCTPVSHVGDTEGALGSWIWPRPSSAIAAGRWVNQPTSHLLSFLSLSLLFKSCVPC